MGTAEVVPSRSKGEVASDIADAEATSAWLNVEATGLVDSDAQARIGLAVAVSWVQDPPERLSKVQWPNRRKDGLWLAPFLGRNCVYIELYLIAVGVGDVKRVRNSVVARSKDCHVVGLELH